MGLLFGQRPDLEWLFKARKVRMTPKTVQTGATRTNWLETEEKIRESRYATDRPRCPANSTTRYSAAIRPDPELSPTPSDLARQSGR